MILIIADSVDGHARLVSKRLREKGAKVVRIDLAEVPERAGLSAWVDERGARMQVRRSEEPSRVDLAEVKTVWFRRASRLGPSEEMEPEDQQFAKDESVCMLVSLAQLLEDRFWVNPATQGLASEGGNGKIAHLELARKLGLAVPRTLATNDPEEARAFLSSLPGAAIYKPFRSPVRTVEVDGEKVFGGIFTSKLDEKALAALDGVRHAPCIFQELVPKTVDLRVTAIGRKVFACAIHSQTHERSEVDFRRRQVVEDVPHSRHELPRAIEEKLLALQEQLGLVYGAFDIMLTPEGRYVFLEVNQQGQFLWLEELAGAPLLEHFTEMLIQGREDYVCSEPWHEPRKFPPLDPI
jgi:glutathione synthase/RimK-type ligase-like ATP-grasp enzyme